MNNSVMNRISNTELTMVKDYISAYGEIQHEEDVNYHREADINYRLRFWTSAKNEYLGKIFGDELILRREVMCARSEAELRNEMSNTLWNSRWNWYDRFLSIPNTYRYRKPNEEFSCWDTLYNRLNDMLNISYLIENKYNGPEFAVYNPNDAEPKPVVISTGCKLLKAIGKILKCCCDCTYDFEDFRIKHSQVLNQKELRGTLCLSIHPMDYITMSDNASGWSSCMGWMPDDGDTEPGCYRRGTVEMMNSPCAVVAYLEGAKPLELTDIDHPTTWNNKKWRTLAIVHKDMITTIKNYPYENVELNMIVVDWLRELVQEKMGWTYETSTAQKWEYGHDFPSTEHRHCVRFETNTMYNDFGCSDHYGIIASNALNVHINYSGESSCMLCGEVEHFGGNEIVYCQNCLDVCYCSCCEGHYTRAEMTWFGDEYLCYNCYEDETITDQITGDRIWSGDMQTVYLVPSIKWVQDHERSDIINCWQIGTAIEPGDCCWSDYFRCEDYQTLHWGWHYYRYVTLDDVTDDFMEAIKEANDWRWDYDEEKKTLYGFKEEEVHENDAD